MQLTPDSLKDHGFIFHEKVKHIEFSSFLSKHSWKQSKLYFTYVLLILFFTLIAAVYFIQSTSPFIYRFSYAGLGVVITLLLVPLHEFIHLLAYKYFGAKKVTITTYFKQCYVLAHADHFIIRKREIKWIALLPFIILSMCGIAILWFPNDLWQISICTFLLFHTSLCQADFLILDYFLSSEDEIAMYDDVKNRVTYIFKQS